MKISIENQPKYEKMVEKATKIKKKGESLNGMKNICQKIGKKCNNFWP